MLIFTSNNIEEIVRELRSHILSFPIERERIMFVMLTINSDIHSVPTLTLIYKNENDEIIEEIWPIRNDFREIVQKMKLEDIIHLIVPQNPKIFKRVPLEYLMNISTYEKLIRERNQIKLLNSIYEVLDFIYDPSKIKVSKDSYGRWRFYQLPSNDEALCFIDKGGKIFNESAQVMFKNEPLNKCIFCGGNCVSDEKTILSKCGIVKFFLSLFYDKDKKPGSADIIQIAYDSIFIKYNFVELYARNNSMYAGIFPCLVGFVELRQCFKKNLLFLRELPDKSSKSQFKNNEKSLSISILRQILMNIPVDFPTVQETFLIHNAGSNISFFFLVQFKDEDNEVRSAIINLSFFENLYLKENISRFELGDATMTEESLQVEDGSIRWKKVKNLSREDIEFIKESWDFILKVHFREKVELWVFDYLKCTIKNTEFGPKIVESENLDEYLPIIFPGGKCEDPGGKLKGYDQESKDLSKQCPYCGKVECRQKANQIADGKFIKIVKYDNPTNMISLPYIIPGPKEFEDTKSKILLHVKFSKLIKKELIGYDSGLSMTAKSMLKILKVHKLTAHSCITFKKTFILYHKEEQDFELIVSGSEILCPECHQQFKANPIDIPVLKYGMSQDKEYAKKFVNFKYELFETKCSYCGTGLLRIRCPWCNKILSPRKDILYIFDLEEDFAIEALCVNGCQLSYTIFQSNYVPHLSKTEAKVYAIDKLKQLNYRVVENYGVKKR